MNEPKKPSFLDGLLEGMAKAEANKPPKPDTENVQIAKDLLHELKLSDEDKASLGGWLMGDAFKGMMIQVLEGD